MSTPSATSATSAIPGMTVAQVRKALASLRDTWASATDTHPLYTSLPLIDGMTIGTFCMQFVLGHHWKRHNKTQLVHKVMTSTRAASGVMASEGVAGPKGDAHDPFPFSRSWRPVTAEGRKAFLGTPWDPSVPCPGAAGAAATGLDGDSEDDLDGQDHDDRYDNQDANADENSDSDDSASSSHSTASEEDGGDMEGAREPASAPRVRTRAQNLGLAALTRRVRVTSSRMQPRRSCRK